MYLGDGQNVSYVIYVTQWLWHVGQGKSVLNHSLQEPPRAPRATTVDS